MSDFFGSLQSMIQLAQMMNNLHNNGLIGNNYLHNDQTFSNIQFMNMLNQPLQNQNDDMTQALNNSFETMEEIKKPTISEEGKQQIKIVEYKSGEYDISSCPITTEEFKEGNTISLLPCSHIFDTDAINHWLENINGVCPLCRYQFPCIVTEEESKHSSSDNENNSDNPDISNSDTSGNETLEQNISYQNYRTSLGMRMPLTINNIGMNYYSNFVNQVIQNQIEDDEDMLLQQVLMDSITGNNESDISQNS